MLMPLVLSANQELKKENAPLFCANLYANLEFVKDYAHRRGRAVPIPKNDLPEHNMSLYENVAQLAELAAMDRILRKNNDGLPADNAYVQSVFSKMEQLNMFLVGKNVPMMVRGEEYEVTLPAIDNPFFVREVTSGTGYRWGPFSMAVYDISESVKNMHIAKLTEGEHLYSAYFAASLHPVTVYRIVGMDEFAPFQIEEHEGARDFGAVLNSVVADMYYRDYEEFSNTLIFGFERREKIFEYSRPLREQLHDIAQAMVDAMKEKK